MKMRILLVTTIAIVFFSVSSFLSSTGNEDKLLEGRWDITIDMNGNLRPSWLEVQHSGVKTLVGSFVGTGGSARPVSKINFADGKFNFTIPPQWDNGDDIVIEGVFHGDSLSGTLKNHDGKILNWTAVRAPELRRSKDPSWGAPVKLFNGKDMTGWKAVGKENQWVVENGILKSPKSGANLMSERKFEDFKLHAEFLCPKGSNSGLYLRGRYEVQIFDSKGLPPANGLMGGIYGFIKPSDNMAKDASEWQTFDVTLIGRMVTLSVNGKTVITNQEIPGITGGAIDSREGEPGPIYIQGDHGPIEFRSIVVTPAK